MADPKKSRTSLPGSESLKPAPSLTTLAAPVKDQNTPLRTKTTLWRPWGRSIDGISASGSNTHLNTISSPVKGIATNMAANSINGSGDVGGTTTFSQLSNSLHSSVEIPAEEEVNARFEVFLAELALPHQKAEQMRSMPCAKKWGLLIQREEKTHPVDTPGRLLYEPGAYVTLLQSGLSSGELAKELQSLDVAMRTQPISWVKQFLDGGGLPVLLRIITSLCSKKSGASVTKDERNAQIYCIRAMKAQMSSSSGLSASLNHPDAVKVLSLALNCETLRTRSMGIEVLAALCLIPPNGHSQVVHAMDHFQALTGEPKRFSTLVQNLINPDLENGSDATNYRDYQAATITFFNALCGSPDEVEVRMALRAELVDLGLVDQIPALLMLDNEVLNTQLAIFQESASNDSELLSESISSNPIQFENLDSVFEALKKQAVQGDSDRLLLRVLQNLVLLPNDNFRRKKYWEFSAIVLKQLCLQRHDLAPDAGRLRMDVDSAIERLTVRESNGLSVSRGSIADLTIPDGADITRLYLVNLQLDFGGITGGIDFGSQDMPTLSIAPQKIISHATASPPPLPTKPDKSSMMATIETPPSQPSLSLPPPPPPPPPPPSSTITTTATATTLPPPPPPPPPPPGGSHAGKPPIPPPGGIKGAPPGSLGAPRTGSLPAKPKLTPHAKMRQIQWTKISPEKIQSSLWKDVGMSASAEESIRREKLDMMELESLFQISPNTNIGGGANGVKGTHENVSVATPTSPVSHNSPEGDSPLKLKAVTVLDLKRSNNVVIMLGRVKLSYSEIREALLKMQDDKLQETLIKQLQVNKPTVEDIELIKEYTGGNDQKLRELGKAEQFLWEVNKVPRLDQRLTVLNYKLKFYDRIAENRPQIDSVMEAIAQLKDNKKIAKLFQVILSIGNYMNADSSAKGGAFGFTLDSLTKLIDVKSSDRKTSILNYIVASIDQKFPDLADLGLSGQVLEQASKVSLVSISQEINELVRGMDGLDRELQNSDPIAKGDMLKVYTEQFVSKEKAELLKFSERHKKMEESFKIVVEYYGEDSSTTPAFFSIFSTFLLHLDRARKENIKLETRPKPSDRSTKLAEKEQEKRKLKENVSKVINSDNKQIMDDLISALKTGDHFKAPARVSTDEAGKPKPPAVLSKPQLRPTIITK
ncbi:hypothetical protein BASA50_000650 [Batrachochytrium salamandrivorans]|uniref:FH2 domain-containing protein n=1 Tax=Batrachochytrium salamandrivorans TaxID=1357716 RepID=A0ABQ8EVS2_9FUNG|nr:hypothetical protein BASA61_010115 [Batrachochytrium salamandrivorans]KAH6586185.1 hypothetical protein BASA50_000650 [Batrachochytrium salamandrivorans]KAH9275964.1 hypothetical protein BASA83_001771 [Batrachochytrium salamandrivorans]